VRVPPTIQALLAARLERLSTEERTLLERGAVEGEVFHRLAVKELADERLALQIDARLASLVRRELIRPHPAMMRGDDAYRFRHLLIRDAAYDALPKAQRADLHERFARWLEQTGAGLPEFDEIVGWHLEQTVRYRRELGQPIDGPLARQAAEHLHAGGQRAGRRGDRFAAISLLERALTLAPEHDQLHASVALALADQLVEMGGTERMETLLAKAECEQALRADVAIVRFEWLIRTRPRDAMRVVGDRLPEIVGEFERNGDVPGLARAHFAWCLADVLASKASGWAEHAALAAEYARQTEDEGLRHRALSWQISALYHGLESAEVVRRAVEALEREDQGAYLAGGIESARGWLARAEDGDFDAARQAVRRAIQLCADMGAPTLAGATYQDLGDLELAAGDPVAACTELERGDRLLAELGEQSYRSTVVALLAWARTLAGECDGAVAAVELAEGLSAAEDILNFVYTHQARSQLASVDGDLDAAERWARSAFDYAYQTELYMCRGTANQQLSRVLAARGRSDEAISAARAALEIYARKGDRPCAAQAQAQFDALTA
jgi:tetratricopeptide (TPR) repeat protein